MRGSGSVALRSLDLCAGIGGFSLGMRLALGDRVRTVCYVEREAYAAAVLVARMEEGALDVAPVWSDLEQLDAARLRGCVDLLTAGFPCQPWSVAGLRRGASDDRWIWPAIERTIRDSRPGIVFLENVPGLASGGGLDPVLRSLAEHGFDAEWDLFQAAQLGAPHRRTRLFLLAANDHGRRLAQQQALHVAAAALEEQPRDDAVRCGEDVADAGRPLLAEREGAPGERPQPAAGGGSWWAVEPDVGVSAHGLSAGLDGGELDAEATQEGPGSLLRSVWLAVGAQAHQRPPGGSRGVPAPHLLRPEVHGAGLCQRHSIVFGLAEAGYPVPWDELRVVWGYGEPARPSHRRQLAERLCREHPDLVRELSCLAPPPCPTCWQDGSWEAGVSRVTVGFPTRVDRLRALGNAVVPQVVACAWHVLSERLFR